VNSLYEGFEKSAASHAERTALLFGGQTLSYAVLIDAVNRLAGGLRNQGFQAGDRIALMLPNIPHFPISYYAVLKIGAVVVPVSAHCRNEEIHHQLEEAEVRGILFWEGYRENVLQIVRGLERCQKRLVLGEKAQAGEIRLNYLIEVSRALEETAPVSPDDSAVIVYTDRIKGRSKGVELSHRNLCANVEACSQFLHVSPDDGTAGVIPFCHMLGQTLVMNLFLVSGARIDLLPRFQAETVRDAVRDQKLTHFIGVPYMFEALLGLNDAEQADLASLKVCLSSGDAMKPEILEAFEAKFRIPVLEGYGLTEASPMVTFNTPKRERKAGSIGLPLPGVDLKIVDENDVEVLPGKVGEIMVQGAGVMKGYLNRPEATKETLRGGWLHTGDLATFDESGHVFVVTRIRNIIVKSGFSIFPNVVEDMLNTHPKIAESVVVGLPDPLQGEEIHGCAVLKSGETAASAEIVDFLKQQIPAYQCPKSIHFVQSLPKGPTGRVIRDQVKQMLLDKESPKKQ
jgi:long-chain acyl-CoA synthetase